jgi:hypothetical protein
LDRLARHQRSLGNPDRAGNRNLDHPPDDPVAAVEGREMKRLTQECRRELLSVLKAFYDATLAEPVPQSIHDKLKRLK